MEYYPYFKALHLIFVITWFAALFYMPRLFIYRVEAENKSTLEKEILSKQLMLMAKRLWFIIGWPSAILATLFAVVLLVLSPVWLQQSWMHIKLVFVAVLILYHLKINQIYSELSKGLVKYSSKYLRLFNEIATLVLFAIVFLVILKSAFNWIYGVVGIIVLGVLLMLGIKIYKRLRNKNTWEQPKK